MRLLREAVIHGDPFDMTMTMLRIRQFEACERRLSAFPGVALFDGKATDKDAQALLNASFDNMTHLGRRRLLTISELKAAVLMRLALEAQFLDVNERYLLMVLLQEGGTAIVEDPARFGAVESLVKRLWCNVRPEGEGWRISLPEPLREPLELAQQQWISGGSQRRLYHFNNVVFSLLYTAGMVDEKRPMEMFLQDVIQRDDWMAHDIARRYMQTQFDYITDGSGKMILVHPALVDPERMLALQRPSGVLSPEVEACQLGIAASMFNIPMERWAAAPEYDQRLDILPDEMPAHEQMTMALTDAVRPDYEPDECAEDLRLLIKQDYSYEEVYEAMKAMLQQMPTKDMDAALRELYLSTPRWVGLRAARVQ